MKKPNKVAVSVVVLLLLVLGTGLFVIWDKEVPEDEVVEEVWFSSSTEVRAWAEAEYDNMMSPPAGTTGVIKLTPSMKLVSDTESELRFEVSQNESTYQQHIETKRYKAEELLKSFFVSEVRDEKSTDKVVIHTWGDSNFEDLNEELQKDITWNIESGEASQGLKQLWYECIPRVAFRLNKKFEEYEVLHWAIYDKNTHVDISQRVQAYTLWGEPSLSGSVDMWHPSPVQLVVDLISSDVHSVELKRLNELVVVGNFECMLVYDRHADSTS